MEPTSNRPSPFVPASQVPLHRNPPLAPSQELAYREKCIALRRRLTEIEANNDNLRKRLEREKRFQDKMRLNRAILLNHLKEMMDSPDTKLSRQDLENLGLGLRGGKNLAEHLGYDLSETPGMRGPSRSEYIMDDSSAESDEEVEPEVRDQKSSYAVILTDHFFSQPHEQLPSRKRARSSANIRDTPMGNTSSMTATPINPGYHQSSLPSLAPAQSHSPIAHHDPSMLNSSFRVLSSGVPVASVPAGYISQPLGERAHNFSHVNSTAMSQLDGNPTPTVAAASAAIVTGPPVRPPAPYEQFTAHMTPQLIDDNYPPEQMPGKIKELWNGMTSVERGLWDQRYKDQMLDYEKGMDEWKREQRKVNSGGFAAVNR
jgi:hypothetical protein